MTGRLLVAALVAVLALVLDGTAFAYWGGSGSGSGAGSTDSTAPVGLSPATPADALRPGGTASVVLTVTNPNPFDVHLGSVALDTGRGFAVDAGHSSCATNTLTFTTQTGGWTAPARVGAVNGVLPITLPGALAMGVTAVNACQGASITVYLVVGP